VTCGIPNHVNVPPQHVAKIQVVAEIVKNFKIVIMRFSARLSLRTGVRTEVVTFEVSRHDALRSQRMRVVELFIWTGSITETQCGFWCELHQQEAPYPNAIHQRVKQWHEEGSVMHKKVTGSAALSLHTTEHCLSVCICWPQSEAISHKHAQTLGMSNKCVWCNLTIT